MALSLGKTLAVVFSLVALAGIVAGVMLDGGPGQQRKRRMDRVRLERLDQLQNGINAFYRAQKRLPDTADLKTAQQNPDYAGFFSPENWQDPFARQPLRYQKTGPTTYTLCARFETDTQTAASSPDNPYGNSYLGDRWRHPAGDHCFPLNAPPPERE